MHLWCLFNVSTQKLNQGLLFDEARAIVGTFDPDELLNWYAWRDDWKDWQPVTQVVGLDEIIVREMPVKLPALPLLDGEPAGIVIPIKMDIGNDAIVDLSVTNIKVAPETREEFDSTTDDSFVVRAKKRYRKRYSVSVEIDGKVFKSHTKDVSVGGVYLEDLIPDWITGYFKIRVGKPNTKQQIELQCCLVEGQPPHARFRFMILPLQNESDEINLENWLAA